MAKLKQRDENEKKRVRGLFFETKKYLVLCTFKWVFETILK